MRREPIRNYGCVFRRSWRIPSIPAGRDRFGQERRIALPRGGLQVRTALYVLAAFAAVWVLRRLPGWFIFPLPIQILDGKLAYLIVPGLIAFALTYYEPDGRPATRFVAAMIAHYLTPRVRSAGRSLRPEGQTWILEPETAVAASSTSPVLQHSTVHGPGDIVFRDEVAVTPDPRQPGCWTIRAATDSDPADIVMTDVRLEDGERLAIRP